MDNNRIFNINLNKSYCKDYKYDEWSGYRSKLTNIINSSKLSGEVLIVGAGNLNDLDIQKINNDDVNLTLLDIDGNAILSGLERQKINKENVKIMKFDLLQAGFVDIMYEFRTSLKNSNLDAFFEKCRNKELNYKLGKFKTIIVSPIYTQILFHQMLEVVKKCDKVDKNETFQRVLIFVGEFLAKINDQLINSLEDDGKIIVISDILEYATNSEELKFLKENIENNEVIDKFHDEYLEKYGYTLGSYGINNIESKMDLIKENYLLWNFDKKRELLVDILSLKKRK